MWTWPYQVVGKPSESLATFKPMGHWARGDRELTTTVYKLQVVRGPVPEDRLAPRVQVNLDELEEDLDDYGEYIRAEAEGAGGPRTPEKFQGDAPGVRGLIGEPGEGVPGEGGEGVPGEGREGREAPEEEPPERGDEAADRGMGAAPGRADPLNGGVAGLAGTAAGPRGEEEPVPGPSRLRQTKGLTAQREATQKPHPRQRGGCGHGARAAGALDQGSPEESMASRRAVEEGSLVPPPPAATTAVAGIPRGCTSRGREGGSQGKGGRTRCLGRDRGGTRRRGDGRRRQHEGGAASRGRRDEHVEVGCPSGRR